MKSVKSYDRTFSESDRGGSDYGARKARERARSLPPILDCAELPVNPKPNDLDITAPGRNRKKKRTHDNGLPESPAQVVDTYAEVTLGMAIRDGSYTVISFLGRGHFSTVWLCEDNRPDSSHKIVAIKISKSCEVYYNIARYERNLYNRTRSKAKKRVQLIMYLLDSFTYTNGDRKHYCIVFPVMIGSVWKTQGRFRQRKLPIPLVQRYAACVLSALRFLHEEVNLIHSDIKPDNILVPPTAQCWKDFNDKRCVQAGNGNMNDVHILDCFDENRAIRSGICVLGDLGCAIFASASTKPKVLQTRPYRAPEVIVGHEYGYGIDLFSLGCTIFELITGQLMFDGRAGSNHSDVEDHLAQIIEKLGPFILSLVHCYRNGRKFFNSEGKLINVMHVDEFSIVNSLRFQHGVSKCEAVVCADFLKRIMELDPEKRYTARKAIMHPFVANAFK